jgi:hypothetical protein
MGDGIDRTEWNSYQKKVATWAVKLPVDVTIPTREGEVEGEGGDYLCIDADGGLYPCDAETFEKMYEPAPVFELNMEGIDAGK